MTSGTRRPSRAPRASSALKQLVAAAGEPALGSDGVVVDLNPELPAQDEDTPGTPAGMVRSAARCVLPAPASPAAATIGVASREEIFGCPPPLTGCPGLDRPGRLEGLDRRPDLLDAPAGHRR
jgi:hypothetical protein